MSFKKSILAFTLFFAALFTFHTNAQYRCTKEDEYLLQKLGYSEHVATRICLNRTHMKEIRRKALKNFEANKVIKVYRGVSIDPSQYNPLHSPKYGIWVARSIEEAPLAYSSYNYNDQRIKEAKAKLKPGEKLYGTLVEFELPYSFFGTSITGTIDLYKFPGLFHPEKALLIYTSRIAKIDIDLSKVYKFEKLYTNLYHTCILDAKHVSQGQKFIEWQNF